MRISLHNITKQYGAQDQILAGVTTSFERINSYGISGSSGVGKSTLLHILAGIERPSSGTICINDEEQNGPLLKQKTGVMLQYPYLLDDLSVVENVMLKGMILGHNKGELEKRARSLLSDLDLGKKGDYAPHILSGGEKQRVALARALCAQPIFLLADEPTAHLDEKNQERILELLNDAHRTYHVGIILVTHNRAIKEKTAIHLTLENGILINNV